VSEVFLGAMYCLHLQGERVSQARNQEEAKHLEFCKFWQTAERYKK
jgi:hypothetical protein